MMIHQANKLLVLNYDSLHYSCFVFFSTLCSYNFHWGITPASDTASIRLGWTYRHKKIHLLLFIIGAIGAGWFFTWFIGHWFWMGISVVLTFLYSAPKLAALRRLRNIAVGKTIFLAMVWMYVTAALPVFISGKSWEPADILFCISRFFFIYSICILFDYRDRDYDKKEGIRSMITYLDNKGVDILFYSTLALFAISSALLIPAGFSVSDTLLIIVPGIIMVPLYKIGKKNFSDYLYYIGLDGMMMLPALLTTIVQ